MQDKVKYPVRSKVTNEFKTIKEALTWADPSNDLKDAR